MRALLCKNVGSLDCLEVAEAPPPLLAPGLVRVGVKAAGVNFPDVLVVQGKYQIHPPTPFSPGSEFSGVVLECSLGVQSFSPGDRVFGLSNFGAFAEEVVVPAERLQRMPDTIDFQDAAVLSMAYGAAMYALFDRGRLQPGERVLILGATGGVGLAAVQLAALLGTKVLAVGGDDDRLQQATAGGAAAVFNYHQGKLSVAASQFSAQGFDVVLDPVGGQLGEQALRCLTWKGRLLVVGFASGEIPKYPGNLLLLKGADALGIFWGESQRRHDNNDRQNFERLLEWHAAGRVKPYIGRTFSLEQAAQALIDLSERRIPGKAVILVDAQV